jgi:release factor glutamine methyltransferase
MERIDALRARFRAEAPRRGTSPRDVDLLLADLTGRTPAWLYAHGEELVDPLPLEALLQRRFAGEPLQYIRGRVEFFGREFLVDGRVLIPRPETEIVVETAIARAPRGGRVADVGTGSGCIAVTLALERPDLRVFAVDVSPAALALAQRNARSLGADVRFAASDVLTATRGAFDLVVSNPPYIPSADVETLATEVRDHEPRIALTPGPRGTEVIERILAQAGDAAVILEIGLGQLPLIGAVEEVVKDLAGIDRVVVLSRHG